MDRLALRAAAVAVASCSIGAQGSPQGPTDAAPSFSSPKATETGVGTASRASSIELQLGSGSSSDFGTTALRSWTGGGESNTSYANPSNWSPNGAPTLSDTLLIDLSPSAAAISASDLVSSSYQLFVGGTVNLNFGSSATPASSLSYTAYTAPSLIIGSEDGTSILNLMSGSTIGVSAIGSEWTQLGSATAGLSELSIGENTQLNTGRLTIESAAEARLNVLGTLFSGYDNVTGGSAPDLFTSINSNATINVGNGGVWKAFDDVLLLNGSIDIEPGGSAVLHHDLSLDTPMSRISAPRLLVGGILPSDGLSVERELSLRAGNVLDDLKSFEVGPEGRMRMMDFGGDSLYIHASDYVKLDGTLDLHFSHGFNPSVGAVLPIIRTDSLTGRFNVHLLPGFEDDRVASIIYENLSGAGAPNALSLSISIIETVTDLIESPPTLVDGVPVAGTLGDLDGDGLPDLVLALPDSNPQQPGSVLILINNGDPDHDGQWNGFGATIQVTVGRNPRSVAVGDFDPATPGLDLAVANAGDNNVTIYSNILNDATDFELRASIPVGNNPVSIIAGGFNTDGKDDLAVACAGSHEIYFLTNTSSSTGSVTFGATTEPVDTVPADMTPADWDEDKDLDVAAVTSGGQTLVLFKNDGNGNFTLAASYPTGNSPRSVAAGTLDGDMDQEIIVANNADGAISIYRNDNSTPGEFEFTIAGALPVGTSAYAAAIVDIDGDNLNDIAVVTTNPNTGLREVNILHNSTVGSDTSFTFSTSSEFGGTNTVSLLTGDINGDGRKDLLSIDDHSANFELAAASGQKFSPASVNVLINASGPRPTCPGDTNGDGVINAADLSVLLRGFGQAHPAMSGPNLNNDTTINGADLAILLSQFGGQCKQ